MRLLKKLNQHRRDFTAIYECDHCGATKQGIGYDDAYFHETVIPNMKCNECGQIAAASTLKTTPDVPAGVVL